MSKRRRIVTIEVDELKYSAWHANWLRTEGVDFFGWLRGDAEMPMESLEGCGIRIIGDESRRPHTVRDWGALEVGDRIIVADEGEIPQSEFRRLQQRASANACMASKRHAPKKFSVRTNMGQIEIRRIA